MPLHDHFRPPLYPSRRWNSFHAGWAMNIATALNAVLPERYHAEPNVTLVVEADVAALDRGGDWTPPGGTASIPWPPAVDTAEVRVFRRMDGLELAAAIELVSEPNKDRPDTRDAFVAKCASYLHAGAGLVVFDAVTVLHANLHAALLASLDAPEGLAPAGDLYVGAYRPVRRKERSELTVWHAPLALGQPLPDVPLWLRAGPCVRVEMEATYMQTWRDPRIAQGRSPRVEAALRRVGQARGVPRLDAPAHRLLELLVAHRPRDGLVQPLHRRAVLGDVRRQELLLRAGPALPRPFLRPRWPRRNRASVHANRRRGLPNAR